jgi:AcrR family transcriptional regulator
MPEMTTEPAAATERRAPLTRARVLDAAVDLADREGIDAVSMRRLGQELGVEAMSLYTHVKSKDDLLDGMADAVVARIPLDRRGQGWQAPLRAMILGARTVMLRHAWAARVIETREAPGPATIRYMDAVAATLLDGGFSVDLAHHGMHVLGSRVLGFGQDLFDDRSDEDPEAAAAIARELAPHFPAVAAIALAASHEGGLGGCDDDVEFAFGLDLVLDGLERERARRATGTGPTPADRSAPDKPAGPDWKMW